MGLPYPVSFLFFSFLARSTFRGLGRDFVWEVGMLDFDMADIKPSVVNAVIVLLLVAITVPLAKWATTAIYIPGLTELIALI